MEKVPESAARATVERCRSAIVLTGWAETVNPKASSYHVLRDFIASSVPANAQWAIERFKSDDEGQSVADAIKKVCCMGVSDGSFKDHFGMACWILKPKDQAGGTIRCPCVVPGGYRSELAGLYGMATMICTLCKLYQITEGEVELACDGLQALRHVSRMEVTTEAKAPQFDLLAATSKASSNSEISSCQSSPG